MKKHEGDEGRPEVKGALGGVAGRTRALSAILSLRTHTGDIPGVSNQRFARRTRNSRALATDAEPNSVSEEGFK
jgi:hypothetical protein